MTLFTFNMPVVSRRSLFYIRYALVILSLVIFAEIIPFKGFSTNTPFNETSGSGMLNRDLIIKGKVTDLTGAPLIGVTIQLKGSSVGTTTGTGGEYSLSVPDDLANSGILVFSYVGYSDKEISINGQTTINVKMEVGNTGLNEVVVVGYGKMKKSDLTGSTTELGAKQLLDKPALNVGEALEGKVAGLQVQRMGGGVPGGKPIVRIRGVNSINTDNDPLFVVDGVVGVSDALNILNPNDIESISVLKDASATAIYGARGSNGVIIITTKRGQSGKIQVDYNGYLTAGIKYRNFYVLNADQLMYVYMQAMANATKYGNIVTGKDFRGETPGNTKFSDLPWLFKQVPKGSYFLDLIGRDGNYYAPRFNSNFEDSIYRSPVFSHNHDISIRGGNDNAKFSLSLGYSDQQGLMKESWFKRYSARLTGDAKMTKWLDLSSSLSFLKSKQTDDNIGGITRTTAETWSIVPVKYPNNPDIYGFYAGRWGVGADFNVGENWLNPIFRRSEESGRTNHYQVTGNVTLTAHITDELSLKSDLAIDFVTTKYNSYAGKLYGGDGSANINTTHTFYWQNQEYFNYDKTFEDHHINAMIGLEWSKYAWQNLNTSNSVFFSNFYQWHNIEAGAATRPVPSNDDGDNELNSYFARINYGFKGKYLITVTGRIDGSSKFGANSKYGFFPSVGLAWRVSDENFVRDHIKGISNLKLRLSYGQTGNQGIGSYVTQADVSAGNIVFGGATKTGIFPTTFGNPDLKWETTTQYDVGIDLGLLKNRINLVVDYYYKKTTDMLLQVPLPQSTTPGSVDMNLGKVQNKGIEFTLNTHNINNRNFTWNTNVTASHNANKILALGPTGAPIYSRTGAGRGTSVLAVGHPIGSFWGLNRIGTYSTEETSLAARYGLKPGDLKFEDKDNDGQIDLIADGQIIGNAFPKWIIGFRNNFTYRNFDFGIDLRIVLGLDKAFIHESAEDRQLVSGGMNTVLQAWRPDHQNSMIAQIRPGNGGAYYQSFADTHMIEDASFIRGQGATIGYTFSDTWVSRIGLSRLRVYLNAENFFLRTKVLDYDPEGSSLGDTEQDNNVPNIDKYQYPHPMNISFGVNVSF